MTPLAALIQTLAIIIKHWIYFFIELCKGGHPLKDLSREIVLVTGAGSGLGRGLAQRFASFGCTVVLWDVDEENNKQTAEMINKTGQKNVHAFKCDLRNKEDIYRCAKIIRDTVGNVTMIVNNAGVVSGKTLMETSDELIQRTFDVNVIAHFWVLKAFLGSMLDENHGHVVSIASGAGLIGRAELHHLKKTGIKTTVVCPSFINTGMFEGIKTAEVAPLLNENDVCDEIINAVRKDEYMLLLPKTLILSVVLTGISPTAATLECQDRLGLSHSMDTFRGRQNSFTFLISFSLCFCLKRDRATYSVSSGGGVVAFNNTNTNVISRNHNDLTIAHDTIDNNGQRRLYSNDIDGYDNILGSGDGEIRPLPPSVHRDSTSSTEDGYTKLKESIATATTTTTTIKPSIEEPPLYTAVLPRMRPPVLVNSSINNNTAVTAAVALPKGCSPSSIIQTSRLSPHENNNSQMLTGFTTGQYEQNQPLPPLNRLPPMPLSLDQLYAGNSNDSLRKPQYTELITRESLQYREQHLGQSAENYYSSVHSEGTGPTSDLYAEIANSSASGTVPTQYQNRTTTNRQPIYYSDDQSERYAVIESDSHLIALPDPTRIYHELDPLTTTTTAPDSTSITMKL
ncbi:unnamed protein product [Didymodactylos carnosus]|uniref:Epidermal retinol dehydrogenase 2 n=1 Tax=Didymodactylos carnosus TaxID=1234261 RepID=A0A813PPP4_9BILA|nr:unnamed protein product [Didymodactylos carnosus]CAF3536904.1 unnamed protein product [Didymodactylos carnosus]